MFDLLRIPIAGRFLHWRYSRIAMQIPLLIIGGIMVAHAFWGPEFAPKNLATLLTWVHFRGIVVLVILLAGNFFCMACPFLLPRELARRFSSPKWQWPRRLRSKWPAIVLFVLVLYLYELFDLWSDPWWTGVVIVAYFAGATIVDSLFRRASFCKYVCPIGQFNFLSSTLSPLEVRVRDLHTCNTCGTRDCIRGTPAPAEKGASSHRLPVIQRGCELKLFQPRKVGNLDCTFCLDCVYACPHDNIGIIARMPGEELAHDGPRSGVGAVERRSDFTALTVVFTFGAVLNAFAMISPVYALEQWIARISGVRVEWPILGLVFGAALVLEPLILLGGAAALTRWLTRSSEPLLFVVNRYARTLVPIGFGIWLAHYGFHFFTGFMTLIPVSQHAAKQAFGTALLGAPQWQLSGFPKSIVFPMELGFLGLGLIGSLMVTASIARNLAPARAWRSAVPFAIVHLLLFVSAVWIMAQPMDMRGTFVGS